MFFPAGVHKSTDRTEHMMVWVLDGRNSAALCLFVALLAAVFPYTLELIET